MASYNICEFFEEFLIPDLRKMVASQLHYYAFSIICQATEVLGSVYDQKSIDVFGQSENRFKIALKNLYKDIRYRNQQGKLFELLRGPLIHQLRPATDFLLASTTKDNIDPDNHLKKDDTGRTYLIVERFLSDFCDAYATFKKECERNKGLDTEKFKAPFIEVSTTKPPVAYSQTTSRYVLNSNISTSNSPFMASTHSETSSSSTYGDTSASPASYTYTEPNPLYLFPPQVTGRAIDPSDEHD